ncbi:hypothetical protein PP175_20335 [Aneurinibacillus sp. Ricciae_BoGa-3]|uniref:hypothetical protein n=1 Tax=Aneurinibacillus sp. Ricciae_BoGa-3 TaxID=3022697 RepID=UPI0023424649|nr:hypothetical protein [Aneurinibacillus sp. Ricciae_BoGa-3]WCK53655.1 hypothetical protein PP175_20335 [Aneurinibacillus sp. Ricciae_BoGa-3]
MNTSSLLVYFLTYFFLTLLLFVLFRKRILEQNSLRYLFLTSALFGAVAPFLSILFGPWFTVALLACLSVGLSAFYVFYTLREERKAQTWEEDFVTDIQTLPSYTETFDEEESSIREEEFQPVKTISSTESIQVNQPTEIHHEVLTKEKIPLDESHVPEHTLGDKQRIPVTEVGETDELLAFASDQELKSLKWDEEETKSTPAAALPYSFIDHDEMIDTEIVENERIDDEPVSNLDSLAEFRFEGENIPPYPNEEAAAKEKPEQLTVTGAQAQQLPVTHEQHKKLAELQDDQEEEKAYYAYLEEVLEEEGLIDTDKNDIRR